MEFAARPSMGLRSMNFFAHGVALLAILAGNASDPGPASLAAILVCLSAFRQVSLSGLFLLRTFEDRWFVNGGEAERLLAPVFVGHWFLVCRFSRTGIVCVGRDSLPDDDFHKLSSLLRIRANRMMAVSG